MYIVYAMFVSLPRGSTTRHLKMPHPVAVPAIKWSDSRRSLNGNAPLGVWWNCKFHSRHNRRPRWWFYSAIDTLWHCDSYNVHIPFGKKGHKASKKYPISDKWSIKEIRMTFIIFIWPIADWVSSNRQTYLCQLQTTQWLLFLEQITQSGTNTNKRWYRRKSFNDAIKMNRKYKKTNMDKFSTKRRRNIKNDFIISNIVRCCW